MILGALRMGFMVERMVVRRILVQIFCIVVTFMLGSRTSVCSAQDERQTEPSLTVVRIDGTSVRLSPSDVQADALRLADGTPFSWDEVLEITTANRLLGDDPTATVVRLRGGGVLQARGLSASDGVVTLTTDLADIKYPLLDIQSIRFAKSEGQAEWETLLNERSLEEDRLLVSTSRGPRVVAGLLEGMDAEGVRIVFEGAERRVTWDKILGIIPATLEKGSEPKFTVQLVDRSILIADSIRFADGAWQFGWGSQLCTLAPEFVVSMRVRSDRVLYLSDLNPVVDEVQTMVAPPAVQRRDANVFGQTMTLRLPAAVGAKLATGGVQSFLKGWGTRSRGRLVFDLPPGFERLQGWVGLDTTTNSQGICQATVLLDGIQVFSQELDGRQSAVVLDVSVAGGRRLELLVEPGPQLDLSDWVNWADVRLLK